ncbi:AAC(3)-I family aminoglycoside N-acetyltransferase [Anderseniella sp. Alg231-50]|uniref:AAC(3)-I family aminoglycoside N-acetyltransferase n=1 Tax=Anderseniella sp. Alg231-50 TaxID=1922226 RepID=UPI000D555D7D
MTQLIPFTIRRLASGDSDMVRDLLVVFGHAFEDEPTYAHAQPDRQYLEKLLGNETVIVLAAMQGAEVVGGLVAYELEKLEQQRSEIYIYDLAVAKPHRRRGIATGLIEQVRIIAAERGAHVMFIQADLEDDPAIQLYTKLGLREDVLHFDIAVT